MPLVTLADALLADLAKTVSLHVQYRITRFGRADQRTLTQERPYWGRRTIGLP